MTDREVAELAGREWGDRPFARIVVPDSLGSDKCPTVARYRGEDMLRLGLAPGAVCTLRRGHEGPHYDSYDRAYWEPEQ